MRDGVEKGVNHTRHCYHYLSSVGGATLKHLVRGHQQQCRCVKYQHIKCVKYQHIKCVKYKHNVKSVKWVIIVRMLYLLKCVTITVLLP